MCESREGDIASSLSLRLSWRVDVDCEFGVDTSLSLSLSGQCCQRTRHPQNAPKISFVRDFFLSLALGLAGVHNTLCALAPFTAEPKRGPELAGNN